MQSKVLVSLFALALVCLLAASCTVESKTHRFPKPEPAAPQSSLVTPQPSSQVSTVSKDFEEYNNKIHADFTLERFDSLDAAAAQLRASKERLRDGAWKLNAFYVGLGGPLTGDQAPDTEWELHISKLSRWLGRYPNSITAHVALADTLINYAMKARGSGYSNTVTPEGRQLFSKRLMMAEDVLKEAAKLKERCPHWYVEALQLGQMQGWDLSDFNKIFDEAVAFEPTYYYYYRVKAMYLLPRWYGAPGEWERFADEASNKLGGNQGAMLYYFITTHIRQFYGNHFFEQNHVSWPRIKEGYELVEKNYGTDAPALSEICLLASQAGDREYAPCVRR